jgi:NTE family protein
MTQSRRRLTTALVLGGGGITGIGWELGLLYGLAEGGADVTDADLIVGTSAGANVGAQVSSGRPLDELYARMLASLAGTKEKSVPVDWTAFMPIYQDAMRGSNHEAARARIGEAALRTATMPEQDRLEQIADRLPSHEWSHRRLMINTVEAVSGEWVRFDRNSGVSLVDAVAASSAVPLIYPPTTIGAHRYIDGGIRSGTNADSAVGYSRVLIVRAEAQELLVESFNPFGVSFAEELAILQHGGVEVSVIEPDAASAVARGPNALDPSRRAPAAEAGRAQGQRMAAGMKRFWQANR